MCGYYCIVSSEKIDLDTSIKSLDLISHRGPDSQKYFLNDQRSIFMGFNRLSILDLRSEADQPMIDEESQRIIIFNGEIYNHNEVRKFLIEKNYTFKTTSDTEVLLKAYDFWKEGLLERLEGMFSFVIYDPIKNNIFFARDRAGEKPLFYLHNKKSFYICSEIKPIYKDSGKKDLSIDGLNHFFENGFTSKDISMIDDIKKLKPGHQAMLNINTLKLDIRRYWNLEKKIIKPLKNIKKQNNYYIDKLELLLGNAVKKQLIADVPVGMMLSGGVDSSLIVATASKYFNQLNTFTVTFPDLQKYDESKHAQLIAKHFNTNHVELNADNVEPEILYKLVKHYDEPMVDSSMIPTYLLSKEIRKHCKVALGGDGADELFGGYSHYNRYNFLAKIQKFIPYPLRNSIVKSVLNLLPKNIRGRKTLELFGKRLNKLEFNNANLFDYKKRGKLFKDNALLKKTILEKKIISTDLVRSATFEDYNNYLSEDILVKVDRASMACSLEVRSPFLDSEITKFAFHEVPSYLKVYKNQRKILPKMLAKKILPKKFDYKRKQGFGFPVNELFRSGKWHDFLEDKINSDQNYFLDKRYCNQLLSRQAKGDNIGESLFAIAFFLVWCEAYVNQR
jgi:asparagine synthase (glutamine-hydrolysing)